MKIKVALHNSGGELDSKVVDSEEGAARAAIELVEAAGDLTHGDKIIVTEIEE